MATSRFGRATAWQPSTSRPAVRLLNEETTLKLDGHTVRLRPSLRCALAIAEEHGPEATDFLAKISAGHVGVLTDILRHGIEDEGQRTHALSWLAAPGPLRKRVELIAPHAYRFGIMLAGGNPDGNERQISSDSDQRVSFIEALARVFATATGVLHWPPDAAWRATVREITIAGWGVRINSPGYKDTEEAKAEEAYRAVANPGAFDRAGFETLRNMQM